MKHGRNDWRPLVQDLLAKISDGRIKLHIIQRTLHHRRQHAELYAEGTYEPLTATGSQRQHVFAFARRSGDTELLVAVPRLVYQLRGGRDALPLGAEVWSDTALLLPGSDNATTFQNVLTAETVAVAADSSERRLSVAELFQSLPLALLARID